MNLSANCITLLICDSPVTVPKAVLTGEVFGTPNRGWLKALIHSQRNWARRLSVICVFVSAERSQLWMPSARTPEWRVGMVRIFDPKCCAELRLNPASVLNQRLMVLSLTGSTISCSIRNSPEGLVTVSMTTPVPALVARRIRQLRWNPRRGGAVVHGFPAPGTRWGEYIIRSR